MSNATNILEELIGTHLFRTGSWTKPGGIHVALFTAVANAETGSVTEVSGGAYARVSVAVADASWTAPTGGNKLFTNAGTIVFPDPSADWGTVTHFGIYDDATLGNLLIVAPLAASRNILGTDPTPSFAIGDLEISFTGSISDDLVDLVGDHLLRTSSWTKPTVLGIALNVSGVEVTGGSYARVARNPLDANWTAPVSGNGVYSNTATIAFPAPTADWGAVDTVAIYNATSAGTEYFRIDLEDPVTIVNGSLAANLAPAALTMTIA